jgi:hypothetical protein
MVSKIIGGGSLAVLFAVALGTAVGARSTYNITVNLDETTRGDMDMVSSSVQTAAIGSEVQRSLRRLANGAAGELALLASQRVDATGNLRLDDGALVTLMDGDEVSVSAMGDTLIEYTAADGSRKSAAQKRVVLIREPCTSGHCSMKPSAILIASGNGGCRQILLFAHPPAVLAC